MCWPYLAPYFNLSHTTIEMIAPILFRQTHPLPPKILKIIFESVHPPPQF